MSQRKISNLDVDLKVIYHEKLRCPMGWTPITVGCHSSRYCKPNECTHPVPGPNRKICLVIETSTLTFNTESCSFSKPPPSLTSLSPPFCECLSKVSHLIICPNSRPPHGELSFHPGCSHFSWKKSQPVQTLLSQLWVQVPSPASSTAVGTLTLQRSLSAFTNSFQVQPILCIKLRQS